MDLKRLDAFLAILDTGTFAAAADFLHTGQSSISASIRVLERDLGVTLFDRSARTAALTAAGRALVPRARILVQEASLTRSLVQDADQQLTGTLRIGVISPADPVPLPQILSDLTSTHPGVSLRVLSDSVGTQGLLERLARSELDLVVAASPFPQQVRIELVTASLVSGDLVCIAAQDDPLAAHKRVTLADMASRTWVEVPPGQANRETTDNAFAGAGLTRDVSVEIGMSSDVPDYVAAGVGVAFVPDFLVQQRQDVRVLRTPGVRLRWTVALARRAERDSVLIRAAWEAIVGGGRGPVGDAR